MKLNQTFESLPDDPDMSEDRRLPNFWVSIIPMVVIFIAYNVLKLELVVALAIGVVLAIIYFEPDSSGGAERKIRRIFICARKGR